jgi:predicted nucleic acid-binding protein
MTWGAMLQVQEYSLGHSCNQGTMPADALIAATAVSNSETLLTANDRHYAFIPNSSEFRMQEIQSR